MRTCTLLAILLCLPALAYPKADSAQTVQNPTEIPQLNALQFHLLGGYSLSYKSQPSNSSAIRYSIDFSFGLQSNSTDGTQKYESPGSFNSNSRASTGDANSQSVGASVHFLYYRNTATTVTPFIGFGPMVSFSRYFSSNDGTYTYESSSNPQPQEDKYTDEISSYTVGAGVIGIAGLECRVTDGVFLLAEYRASANYNWTKEKQTSTSSFPSSNSSDYTTKGWNINLNSIRLGIGVTL